MNMPLRDALIEVWQTNVEGHTTHPEGGGPVQDGVRGCGRIVPDVDSGAWAMNTARPGPAPARTPHAPNLTLWLVARGIILGLDRRIYVANETVANGSGPISILIEWEGRRASLIAARGPAVDGEGVACHRVDIHLQGERETVFFDV